MDETPHPDNVTAILTVRATKTVRNLPFDFIVHHLPDIHGTQVDDPYVKKVAQRTPYPAPLEKRNGVAALHCSTKRARNHIAQDD